MKEALAAQNAADADLQATNKEWEAGAAARNRAIEELNLQANKLVKVQEDHKKFHTTINNSKNKIKELEKQMDNTKEKQSDNTQQRAHARWLWLWRWWSLSLTALVFCYLLCVCQASP